MGYETSFQLAWFNGDPAIDEAIWNHLKNCDWPMDDLNTVNYTHAKWYSYEEDMLVLSKNFPEILFVLEGHGEEIGDHWRCYFKDGKKQMCKGNVVYDAFDPREFH